ncbi:unnamed protein product [Rhizophagus irregularis]|uniref:Uncharacterized protein n=2 Tax=Rhizophagus irregularis TaxID=588596 RepID=A0A916E285_9GLOM|nr:unnamed protein product [Rhizophagus irregularis]
MMIAWEMMIATGNKRLQIWGQKTRIREGNLCNLRFRSQTGIKRIRKVGNCLTKEIITLGSSDFSSDYSDEADNFDNPDNYIRTPGGCSATENPYEERILNPDFTSLKSSKCFPKQHLKIEEYHYT